MLSCKPLVVNWRILTAFVLPNTTELSPLDLEWMCTMIRALPGFITRTVHFNPFLYGDLTS